MGGWMRWILVAAGACTLAGCNRSSTGPSPSVVEPRRATIDFEALAPPSPPTEGTVIRGCSYAEDGFTLETLSGNCSLVGGFMSVHMPPNPMGQYSVNRYVGSVSFSNHAWDGMTRLMRDGGATFALVSIDLDALNPSSSLNPADRSDASWPQTVTFVGTRLDGASVTQGFTTDTSFPRLETFVFRSDFSELTRVEWRQVGPMFHQFDNIVVAAR